MTDFELLRSEIGQFFCWKKNRKNDENFFSLFCSYYVLLTVLCSLDLVWCSKSPFYFTKQSVERYDEAECLFPDSKYIVNHFPNKILTLIFWNVSWCCMIIYSFTHDFQNMIWPLYWLFSEVKRTFRTSYQVQGT